MTSRRTARFGCASRRRAGRGSVGSPGSVNWRLVRAPSGVGAGAQACHLAVLASANCAILRRGLRGHRGGGAAGARSSGRSARVRGGATWRFDCAPVAPSLGGCEGVPLGGSIARQLRPRWVGARGCHLAVLADASCALAARVRGGATWRFDCAPVAPSLRGCEGVPLGGSIARQLRPRCAGAPRGCHLAVRLRASCALDGWVRRAGATWRTSRTPVEPPTTRHGL